MLSKNFRKFLFFWVIFNFLGYFSFLADIHPKFQYEEGGASYTNYLLTPDCSEGTEEENFYPFHDFYPEYYGGYSNGGFLGIYGYYGHYEFLFYVVFPLFIIGVIWLYKEFFA